MKKQVLLSVLVLVLLLTVKLFSASADDGAAGETCTVRILYTSDLHGYFTDHSYITDEDYPAGSMARVASVIRERRNENTLVLDAGDIIQGNMADMFLKENGYGGLHPMAAAMNRIGYDAWTTGNHEYNFGQEALLDFIGEMDAPLILGNVSKDGKPLGEPYRIFDVNGIRVAVVAGVTELITKLDGDKLSGWNVESPAVSARRALDTIGSGADVRIALMHVDLESDTGFPGSGARDIAAVCPEFDAVLAAHGHQLVAGERCGKVLLTENRSQGDTVMQLDITLTRAASGEWQVMSIVPEAIECAAYEPDPEVYETVAEADAAAREDINRPIGILTDDLIPKGSTDGAVSVLLGPSPWMQFLWDVEKYYTGADICTAAPTVLNVTLEKGPLTVASLSRIWYYSNNMLRVVRMTGAQLKRYMEWAVRGYNTIKPGDVTVSCSEEVRPYRYDSFSGVHYEVNVSKPPYSRIENLTHPDGTPVMDTEIFTVCVTDYREMTALFSEAEGIFTQDNFPEPVEPENPIRDESALELIYEYIVNVLNGTVEPYSEENWRLTGTCTDEELYRKAIELIDAGVLIPEVSANGRVPNVKSFTEEDVRAAEAAK